METLSDNAAGMGESIGTPSFTSSEILFTHWGFESDHTWSTHAWLAECEIESENFRQAIFDFRRKLNRVISRVSLLGQAYIQHLNQTYLVVKENSDFAYFFHVVDEEPISLMFQDDEQRALELLLVNTRIREEFYYYWNDAVNATGYSSKLLIMCAAIEALSRSVDKNGIKIGTEAILGTELKDTIFKRSSGLRNRLAHGDYLSAEDTSDYVEIIHKAVIKYFNISVLEESLIEENVVQPQRNFRNYGRWAAIWIRKVDSAWPLELVKVIESTESSTGNHFPSHYGSVASDDVVDDY